MLEEKILKLTDAQKQMWLLEQINPNSPTNHITDLVIRINSPVDLGVVQSCLQEIVNRHESLRTTIKTLNGQPKQIIHPKINLDFTFYDLQYSNGFDREKEAIRLASEEARRPFDLENGPLVRAALIRKNDNDYILIIPTHHIISDGWSSGVL